MSSPASLGRQDRQDVPAVALKWRGQSVCVHLIELLAIPELMIYLEDPSNLAIHAWGENRISDQIAFIGGNILPFLFLPA